tara:strand:- start:1296 stop:1661 length:366 start_codon:yes stop_codon:yes gene_type:complete
MPILKSEIELSDGKKIWVRQATGMEKIGIESVQAKAVRKCRHFGSDPSKWTDEQNEEFLELIDSLGGSVEDQVNNWVPVCVLENEYGITADDLNSEELRSVLAFVRGDTNEGAVPLESSQE